LHAGDQRQDLEFVANELTSIASDAADALSGAFNADRYVVAGQSTGGTVTLLALFAPDQHDARVAGGIDISSDACFFGDSFFKTRALPLLVLAGSSDRIVPHPNNTARVYSLSLPPKISATFVGGKHLHFTGSNRDEDQLGVLPVNTSSDLAIALEAYGGGTACEPVPPPGTDPTMDFDEQHRHAIAWTTAFLDRVLHGQATALDGLKDANDPAVVVVHDGL
jgi:fermentation-respiration switch protein FrsA (DUF1100 family)